MSERQKTLYPGVYFIKGKRRSKTGTEKIFYIVFRKDGKQHEEKAGRQYEDNMTPAKAAGIRAERIEGKRISNMERRIKIRQEQQAIKNKWSITRLWEQYKTLHPNLKGLVQDQNRFTLYIEPRFGTKEPRELSAFEVGQFRSSLLKKKQPATVHNILELLRRIINFGMKNELCQGTTFKIQMPKVNNLKTEDLSPDELNRLIKAIDEEPDIQVANMLRMALLTGMRRGEIFRLRWEDIDFERGFIRIQDPKGGQDATIPLNQKTRQILEIHPRTKSPFIFPGREGGPRADANKRVNQIKERACLPADFRPFHGLRHVYASMLASSGEVDMYTLQKLLTHKSPHMTQRYAHLRDEALQRASDLAGRIIDQTVNKNSKQSISQKR